MESDMSLKDSSDCRVETVLKEARQEAGRLVIAGVIDAKYLCKDTESGWDKEVI